MQQIKVSYFTFLTILFFTSGCKNGTSSSVNKVVDNVENHSYSNYKEVFCTHLQWNANVNFDAKKIEATAIWNFTNEKNAKEIILDTKQLQVQSVSVNGTPVQFFVDTADHEYLGSALHIKISNGDSIVAIQYQTGENAKALQWLTAQQTADKTMPYLFTQCEAIAARSIIPCQDVPANRITYNATVKVPVGMLALMSAENPQVKNNTGIYQFSMPIPIPSYLIALAVGNIQFKAIDARCGVYAEPSVLAKAALELNDVPAMMQAAEKMVGPYFWKRYDVLIQPPSFPIGGMENPKLTFATPTILAGDKSLVSLVAHELAHSWSGNTVTNAAWNDLWLNEGFTTYFERRIMESITDTTYADMLWELSYQDMMSDLKDLGEKNADTKLQLDLKGRDPEDAFSNIPYEKGAHLLWLVEKTVGRATFDTFLVKYFTDNKFVPMTTEKALAFMDKNLFSKNETWKKNININQWIFEPGVPTNCPRPKFIRFTTVDSIRTLLENSNYTNKQVTKNWSTHEWLQYLRKLPRNLELSKMKLLDATYNFTNTRNSEIAFEWYMLSLQTQYTPAYTSLESFLSRVGRKKFVKPLYTKMMENKTQAILAKKIFAAAKNNYHPATTKAVQEVVEK